ncbi:hydrolase [Actinomycetes bacterium]|nr:hydrolase [Actinomycetes bacterium]
MGVTVALIQLDCSSVEPVYKRVPRALGLVAKAAAKAQFIVLPELWHVGAFDIAAAREHAQAITGPLVTDLGALAKQHGIWLHGGSFCEESDGSYFNTSVLFSPEGDLRATYRKIHLFGFEGGETTLMSGGEELVVVDTPLGATGMATCYDLRFPELFRALTEGGATAFLVTSGWPTLRIGHWDVLTQARAIENQAWLIACNEVGAQPGIALGGHSCVIDPKGVVVASGGGSEEIIYVDVDPELPEAWRVRFPVLGDIRLR